MSLTEQKEIPIQKVLHFTVNRSGRVSLWDDARSAMYAVREGEHYVHHVIDQELEKKFVNAAQIAII